VASYRVFIKPSAVREIEAIPKKDRERITNRIKTLSEDPRLAGCEKLSGQERYRLRQGRYRVIYAIDDERKTVVVFKVGHRRDVYR
jgi:mRNA interferase RelE/StbE